MSRIFVAALIIALQLGPDRAAADIPLVGFFIAREACPALQSIRKETNPGEVRLTPDRSYPLLAKNKPAASHYFIDIEGARPSRRWVAVTCGEHVVPADGSVPPRRGGGGPVPADDGGDTARQPAYVLAISWQPSFCEGKSDKTECRTQTTDRFDATHFTLHGLWPQPASNSFCHVSPDLIAADKDKEWDKLPALKLEPETRAKLDEVMPGTMSNLERHEWIKHGTCFQGETAEEYYARAIALMSQLNASKVRDLFSSRIGSEITNAEIRDAFDASFGEGAGERVRVACKRDGGRNLIVELTVGLVGEIGESPSLPDLIAASAPTGSGCPRGTVDPVGLQ